MTTRMTVDIKSGLFPSEKTIQFADASGQEIAIFVHAEQVDESKKTVLVRVLEQNEKYALVQIGSSFAKVAREKLVQGL